MTMETERIERNALIKVAEIKINADLYPAPGVFLLFEYGDGATHQAPFLSVERPRYVQQLMAVAGVEEWSRMVGRAVRVRLRKLKNGGSGTVVAGVGHVVREVWCDYEEEVVGL